jgi:hypothetical protein
MIQLLAVLTSALLQHCFLQNTYKGAHCSVFVLIITNFSCENPPESVFFYFRTFMTDKGEASLRVNLCKIILPCKKLAVS